ncbi:MAG: hypothetical protein ABFE08_06865 [Armatimonadia bacterium]
MRRQKRRNEQVDWRQGAPVLRCLGCLFAFSIAIGILALIIAPRDKNVTPSVQCLANLKALRVATLAYATDHENVLPPVAQVTTPAMLRKAVLKPGEQIEPYWAPDDWRRLLLAYNVRPEQFVCPNANSALSYDLGSRPKGLDQVLISDKLNYALLWDVGLQEEPGKGPHAGKYAVETLGEVGFATTGKDDLAARLRFRP